MLPAGPMKSRTMHVHTYERETMRHMNRAAGVAVITGLALTMAACSASGGSGGGSDAAACEPSDGEVTLTFTSWIPGIEDAVAIWNDANPDIQVEVQTGP